MQKTVPLRCCSAGGTVIGRQVTIYSTVEVEIQKTSLVWANGTASNAEMRPRRALFTA